MPHDVPAGTVLAAPASAARRWLRAPVPARRRLQCCTRRLSPAPHRTRTPPRRRRRGHAAQVAQARLRCGDGAACVARRRCRAAHLLASNTAAARVLRRIRRPPRAPVARCARREGAGGGACGGHHALWAAASCSQLLLRRPPRPPPPAHATPVAPRRRATRRQRWRRRAVLSSVLCELLHTLSPLTAATPTRTPAAVHAAGARATPASAARRWLRAPVPARRRLQCCTRRLSPAPHRTRTPPRRLPGVGASAGPHMVRAGVVARGARSATAGATTRVQSCSAAAPRASSCAPTARCGSHPLRRRRAVSMYDAPRDARRVSQARAVGWALKPCAGGGITVVTTTRVHVPGESHCSAAAPPAPLLTDAALRAALQATLCAGQSSAWCSLQQYTTVRQRLHSLNIPKDFSRHLQVPSAQ